jgi:hypothetical protein
MVATLIGIKVELRDKHLQRYQSFNAVLHKMYLDGAFPEMA